MSYFLLLKPFHMVLSGMVLPDGEDSLHSTKPIEKLLQGKIKGRLGRAGSQSCSQLL